MKRRIFSILLAVVMLLGMLPVSALAAETDAPVVNGVYTDGSWSSGGNGTATYTVDGTDVTLSKTAAPVAGMANTYDVTLQVRTSTSTTTSTPAGAVVLVVDVSSSMRFCAECGGDGEHNWDCDHRGRVSENQSRIVAAKSAALNFLSSYAGNDPTANRQLAIVTFGTNANTRLNWVNVAGGTGNNSYDAAESVIKGLSAPIGNGTNLEAGLKSALDVLNKIEGKSENLILLTDGKPTYRIGAGNGMYGDRSFCNAAANRATAIKNGGATLYTVCYGASGDEAYYDGPSVGAFLADNIASSGKNYSADNSSQLASAFKPISTEITNGLSGAGWIATDPMADGIDVLSAPSAFVNGDGETYNWTLSDARTEKVDNVTYHIYELTYRVTLNVQMPGFSEGVYYPTNDPTYLTIDGKQYAFPVPGVQGVLPRTQVIVSKTWDDDGNRDNLRTEFVTVQLQKDGVNYGAPVRLSASNGWTYTWTDLVEMSGGNLHQYTVMETEVPAGYTPSTVVSGNTVTLTNTHISEQISISGSKTWNDNNNQDGKRPASITINLLKNGQLAASKTVTAADNWNWTFDNLYKYENGSLITYAITEAAVDGYTTVVNGYDVTNSYTPQKTSVAVTKAWEDGNNQDGIRPNDITVVLLANGEETGDTLTLNTGNNWSGTFTDLDVYKSGQMITYTVKEIAVPGYKTAITGNAKTGFVITNSHTTEITSVSGSKTWDDNNDQDGKRPASITINLLKNGETLASKIVTAEDNWSWTFDNLPKYENGGSLIRYTITENSIEGYSAIVDGYNVTNSYTPEKTSIAVTKAWTDGNNQDGIRPNDITVILLADGNATGKELLLNAGNNWSGSFTDLDVYQEGQRIVYTVEEIAIPGYDTIVTGDALNGFTINNTHTPETIRISGSKTWNDNDNQDGKRPVSITINLLKNGQPLDSKTVTAADNWSWTFENLAKYENGSLITYVITETTVEGYTAEFNGYDVTNSYTPEKTSISVTKAWVDNNDQDGIRPNSVTVVLLADGEPTGEELLLNAGNNWAGSFTGLDVYKAGQKITYTVQEVAVPGYETVISGNAENGITVTNSHTPATVAISGSKTWNDNNNQDGKRPASITINLLKNGQPVASKTVTEADGWKWSFENQPKYDDGNLITYAITETAIDGYTAEINGYNVTNSYTPEKTGVSVTKAWTDSNDQDGIRPNSVTVVLLADGKSTGKELLLNAGNNWSDSFTGLDVYQAGKEIVYTVEEITVPGYETVITGNAKNGFIITNSHTPAAVELSGSKTWVDNDDQDGKRPEAITIHLLADGVAIQSKTVTAADGWKWNFTSLPKYKDQGTMIVYSITEEAVEGYTAAYNGYNVINTHAIDKTSVSVAKTWADNNNQDGIRPNDITVELLANGKSTGKTLLLSIGNHWTGTFTNLDVFAGGKQIVYTVKELTVAGYASVITGDQTTGYTITNSHTPETIAISGEKAWIDNDNQDGMRPESIVINLLKNGQPVDEKIVKAEDNWSWTFENLPKYENGGKEIVYAISETAVEGYTTIYDGFDVINTHDPEKTSITVAKSWQDNNDQDGIRPDSVEVKLLANGEDTGIVLTLSVDNNWTGTLTELDKFASGSEIVYTVEEVAVTGYATTITGDMTAGYTITNTHTPETVTVTGAKTWNDAENQDGKRPESITIKLLADGIETASVTVTEQTGWTWTFENLPKFSAGKQIVYIVSEAAVEGYTAEYDGHNITNTYAPEQINIHVVKVWADQNDVYGKRPAQIQISLYANDVLTDTLTLNADMNWTGTFDGLPKYENGTEITYTIKEEAAEGYKAVITGDAANGFTVTNSFTDNPQTGDQNMPVLWIGGMTVSLLGIIAVLLASQKKRKAY